MASAAKCYAISGLELGLGEERLTADVVRRQVLTRMAIYAPVAITFSNKLTPPAQAAFAS